MKKILLATTVLAATAGVASAEMAVTGSARMGIISVAGGDAEFTSRFRVSFTGSGETDNGLSFGGSVRNDQSGVGNTANGDSTLFISGAFGKITMGDVSGAADALVGQVSSVGLTGLGSLNEIGYLSNTKTAALYTYTAGALTFGLGVGQPTGTDKARSVAVKYSTDAYTAAIGFEDVTGDEQLSLGGSATFSGVTVKARYATRRSIATDAYALSVDYTMSGTTVTAFYSDLGLSTYGIGASYDLGGGAAIKGGIVKPEGIDASFDLGVSMSF